MGSVTSFRSNALALMFLMALSLLFLPAPLAPRPTGAHPSSFKRSPAQDQDDVVRVNTDLVVLNATVLDKDGKFVPGLKLTDFQIFEDGAEQKTVGFSAEETPFAAAILLDTSGSMETRLTLGRSAAIRFLEGLREEDVAAVYNFDIKVEQMQDFSPGRDLPARAFGLHTKMMTALNDAVLRGADDLAKRAEKRRAIVVLSDGGENSSRASAGKALDHALQAGATIYAVNMSETGPGRDIVGESILKNLAEKSGGRYVASPGGQSLRDSFAAIAEELGHQYTLVYRPLNRERDGRFRAIQIKTDRPGVNIRTRKGYRAPKS
ncbi:MAG: Ca-activated chloride channel [Blastocatellia bacterium]|nr:Ca-activated chloride channel [Blastocatellia bacterium]